jgi:hypothetical protein
LAYALYKESVHQEANAGQWRAGADRNPSNAMVGAFRDKARLRLQLFATHTIEATTPRILENATVQRLDRLTVDLGTLGDRVVAHVDKRTAAGSAVLWNVVAWFVSIALTALVLVSLTLPNIGPSLAGFLQRLIGPGQ